MAMIVRRAGEARALDDVETDAAAADHGDRVARLHVGGVECGAETGDDRTSEDARQLQRDVAVDRSDGSLVEEDQVGKRTDVGHLPDADSIEGQPWGKPACPLGHLRMQARVSARRRCNARTRRNPSRGTSRRGRRRDVAHVGPDGFDDAGALVPEDHRSRAAERAVEVVVVAVAQPGGDGAHQYLAPDRIIVLHIGDVELVGTVKQYRGAHAAERRRDYFAGRRWRGTV